MLGIVVRHQCSDVVEVARAGASPQREHLVGGEVVGVQDEADVEDDARPEPSSVGEDLDGAFATGGGIDGDEAMIEWRSIVVVRDEAELLESGSQCCGDVTSLVVVDLGKQVDVLRCAADEAMGDHGSAAGERNGVGLGQTRCGADDQILERIERHRSGRGAGFVDEWEPGSAYSLWQVHVVPDVDQALAVYQPLDVVEGALDEDDLVEVATAVAICEIPPDFTGPRTGPEQRRRQADASRRGTVQVGQGSRHRHVTGPPGTSCWSLPVGHTFMVPDGASDDETTRWPVTRFVTRNHVDQRA